MNRWFLSRRAGGALHLFFFPVDAIRFRSLLYSVLIPATMPLALFLTLKNVPSVLFFGVTSVVYLLRFPDGGLE